MPTPFLLVAEALGKSRYIKTITYTESNYFVVSAIEQFQRKSKRKLQTCQDSSGNPSSYHILM